MIAGAEHCGPGGCKLRIAGVSKVFDGRRGKVVALEGINLNIRGGEFVCLVGASGCGKTSLLNIIAGLEFPSSGVVELDGEPVTGPGRDRTVMFQESALFPWLDVMGNVMFGLNLVPGLTRGDRLAMAEKNLELVGLKECAHAHIHELSGGMKQRVALARALATSPRILLMDEPFAALDAMTREQLYQDIQEIHLRCGMTIVSLRIICARPCAWGIAWCCSLRIRGASVRNISWISLIPGISTAVIWRHCPPALPVI